MKLFTEIKLIVAASLIAVFGASCGNEEIAEDTIETIFTEEVIEGDEEKTMAYIELDGMTCEVGCARYIKGKLASFKGVEQTEVVFDEDLAMVTFNPDLVNEKELVSFIHGLHDGQYKVSKINKVKMVKRSGGASDESGNKSSASSDLESVSYESFRSIAFPNIFNIFKLKFI
jgi:periplasmic mercuric ion binding protein